MHAVSTVIMSVGLCEVVEDQYNGGTSSLTSSPRRVFVCSLQFRNLRKRRKREKRFLAFSLNSFDKARHEASIVPIIGDPGPGRCCREQLDRGRPRVDRVGGVQRQMRRWHATAHQGAMRRRVLRDRVRVVLHAHV